MSSADGYSATFLAADQQVRIACSSDLEEVAVVGEVAYTRVRLEPRHALTSELPVHPLTR